MSKKEIIYLSKPVFRDSLKRSKRSERIEYSSFFNNSDNSNSSNISNNSNLLDNSIDALASILSSKSYYIHTHGCQANIRDEESISGILSNELNMDRVIVDDDTYLSKLYKDTNSLFYKELSIIVINTCSVRENANNKVYAELGNLKRIKEKNPNLIIILCGCMVEVEDSLNIVLNKYPQVDIIFGTHNIPKLSLLLNDYLIKYKKEKRIVDVMSYEGDVIENTPILRNNSFQAYINISFGCDKFCSYCIVPQTRGKERSRDIEDILKEVKLLKKLGYKEITLLGQNVDSYGKDFINSDNHKSHVDFGYLLESVAKLGIPRVRFLTSYPSDFKDNVIDVIAKYPNIMKYIHLPVQSGSNTVLKRMNRRYTREEYLELVDKIKTKIPDIALSTDIIVGFPNETNEEFEETLDLVKKVEYASSFNFIYSPRANTLASKMEDKVTEKEKVERFKRLTSAMEEGIKKDNAKYLNKVKEVLVTAVSKTNKNYLAGILENNKTVNFLGDPSLIGNIVKVKITEDKLYSFIGELIKE